MKSELNKIKYTSVFVITGLNANGAETMLLKLLERINRDRFSPFVISLTTMGGIGPKIQQLGIPVEALGIQSILGVPKAFLCLLMRFKELKPDFVHTWMYHADLLGGLAAWLAGIKAITWGIVHSNLSSDLNKPSTLRIVRVCAFLSRWIPARILSCSEVARRIHVDYGYVENRFVVLPLGFDLNRFKPNSSARKIIRSELGIGNEIPLIGLVGRYDPQKNHKGFINACSMVNDKFPEAHFLLAGYGVDYENIHLVDDINNAGIKGRVHLLGVRDDIPNVMASLDILASSSFGEGFPNVLGEAMASGVICVVTDVGDSAYVIGDTGRIVKSGDMRGLADSVIELLESDKVHIAMLRESARKRVVSKFEIGMIVQQYEEFYEKLICDSLEVS